jgi:hypothetical protein
MSEVRARPHRLGASTPGPQRNHAPPRLAPLMGTPRARVAAECNATIAEPRARVMAEQRTRAGHPVMWPALARLGLTLDKTGHLSPIEGEAGAMAESN